MPTRTTFADDPGECPVCHVAPGITDGRGITQPCDGCQEKGYHTELSTRRRTLALRKRFSMPRPAGPPGEKP